MITKFKLYESSDVGKPELGDYVICYEKDDSAGLLKWIETIIGKIIKVNDDDDICKFDIKYENFPEDIEHFFYDHDGERYRPMKDCEVLHWSKNKEDLDVIININKYNL